MKHYPTLRAHLPWDKPGKIHDTFHGPECEYIPRSHLQYAQDSWEHGPQLPVWFTIVMSCDNKFWPYLHPRCLINKVMILYKMPQFLVHYCLLIVLVEEYSKGKAVLLQAWSGPEDSRKLWFPDFMTTAQDGGKVVGLRHWPPLPPGNTPGTHIC